MFDSVRLFVSVCVCVSVCLTQVSHTLKNIIECSSQGAFKMVVVSTGCVSAVDHTFNSHLWVIRSG